MLMFDVNKTTEKLAMAITVHWYGHVPRREDGHLLRTALDLKVDGQTKSKENMEVTG